jgi:hypothetical protein
MVALHTVHNPQPRTSPKRKPLACPPAYTACVRWGALTPQDLVSSFFAKNQYDTSKLSNFRFGKPVNKSKSDSEEADFVEYAIHCVSTEGRDWTIGKRFSAFSRLREQLLKKEGASKAAFLGDLTTPKMKPRPLRPAGAGAPTPLTLGAQGSGGRSSPNGEAASDEDGSHEGDGAAAVTLEADSDEEASASAAEEEEDVGEGGQSEPPLLVKIIRASTRTKVVDGREKAATTYLLQCTPSLRASESDDPDSDRRRRRSEHFTWTTPKRYSDFAELRTALLSAPQAEVSAGVGALTFPGKLNLFSTAEQVSDMARASQPPPARSLGWSGSSGVCGSNRPGAYAQVAALRQPALEQWINDVLGIVGMESPAIALFLAPSADADDDEEEEEEEEEEGQEEEDS